MVIVIIIIDAIQWCYKSENLFTFPNEYFAENSRWVPPCYISLARYFFVVSLHPTSFLII